MEREKQVCSPELSIKLKELGLRVESLWYWFIDDIRDNSAWCLDTDMNINDDGIYNAFTVSELGEMLPCLIKKEVNDFYLNFAKYSKDGDWWCKYKVLDGSESFAINGKTLTEASAKMLCFLLESNLIKIQDINLK